VTLEMSGSKSALKDALSLTKYCGRISLLGLFDGDVQIDLTDSVIFKKLEYMVLPEEESSKHGKLFHLFFRRVGWMQAL